MVNFQIRPNSKNCWLTWTRVHESAGEESFQLDREQGDVNSSGIDAIRLGSHISAAFLVAQAASLPSIVKVAQEQGKGAAGDVASKEDFLPLLATWNRTVLLVKC